MPVDLQVNVTVSFERELTLALHITSDRLAVVGPSGSGKSTLLRVLAGLEPRAHGIVRVGDRAWQSGSFAAAVPAWERKIGWSPQDGTLFPHVSVRRNLLWNVEDTTDLMVVSEALGIAELLERRPRNLSGGERARVSLGRALLARPRLLLLDEPLVALDRSRRSSVAAFVREHCTTRQIPYVLVSHDDRDVSVLADETVSLP